MTTQLENLFISTRINYYFLIVYFILIYKIIFVTLYFHHKFYLKEVDFIKGNKYNKRDFIIK